MKHEAEENVKGWSNSFRPYRFTVRAHVSGLIQRFVCVKLGVLVAEEHKNRERRKARNREKIGGNSRFLDGFELDSKHFSRDQSSSKLLGKLYKLCNDFKALKIEFEP